MKSVNNDFTIVKGKGLHNFSVLPLGKLKDKNLQKEKEVYTSKKA
ncbi:MAG: hypothetical protein AAGI07_17605 [Bacteroidota bacterium]